MWLVLPKQLCVSAILCIKIVFLHQIGFLVMLLYLIVFNHNDISMMFLLGEYYYYWHVRVFSCLDMSKFIGVIIFAISNRSMLLSLYSSLL